MRSTAEAETVLHMIYATGREWLEAANKRILLYGMSGIGKTRLAQLLRDNGDWYHYSVDYRIGTRYMDEHIVDNFKREAMKSALLAQLLKSDSIYISSNFTFGNLAPLSTFIGKPGAASKGGVPVEEYRRRQALHAAAEKAALLDTGHFIDRAKGIYGYDHFVCDSGGSICEIADPADEEDPILAVLAKHHLMIWIEDGPEQSERLAEQFVRYPKPMYYAPAFFERNLDVYCRQGNVGIDRIDPDDFACWLYRHATRRRRDLYAAMASNFGLSIKAGELDRICDADGFNALVAAKIDQLNGAGEGS